MRIAGAIFELVSYLYLILLLTRLVVDTVQSFAREWTPRGPLLVALEGVYTATDPPINAVRRILPPLRLGGIALDVGFMVVLVAVYLLRILNANLLLS